MVVADSSALLAILLKEYDWTGYLDVLNGSQRKMMAAPNWLEACLVSDSRGNDYVGRFAHRRFGRGSEHPAHLNFGDCIAYVLARTVGAPLLFKGDDFTQNDITPALAA